MLREIVHHRFRPLRCSSPARSNSPGTIYAGRWFCVSCIHSTSSFVPRSTFPAPENNSFTWFPGHMLAGLRAVASTMADIDLIIETRDARIPLSSRNPYLEDVCAEKRRLVLYNKRDLAGLTEKEENRILGWHTRSGDEAMFTNIHDPNDIRRVIRCMKEIAKTIERKGGMKTIIIGMPNTGKSSMLNVIRRHATDRKWKAVKTSSQAGLTRKLSTSIKVIDNPLIYMSDTPGVMMPFIPTPETFLSLALCGSIRDKIVPPEILADYLLYHLNLQNPELYTAIYDLQPTNDVAEFLAAVAQKTGKLLRGGYIDDQAAAMESVTRFRRGALGAWPIDRITPDAFHKRIKEELAARQRESRGVGNLVESRKPRKFNGTMTTAIEQGRQVGATRKSPSGKSSTRSKKSTSIPRRSRGGQRKTINRNKGTKRRKR